MPEHRSWRLDEATHSALLLDAVCRRIESEFTYRNCLSTQNENSCALFSVMTRFAWIVSHLQNLSLAYMTFANQFHGFRLNSFISGQFQTVKSLFAVHDFPCLSSGNILAFEDKGHGNDFACMWDVILSLLCSNWFMNCAVSCVPQNEDGEENILAQAGKIQGPCSMSISWKEITFDLSQGALKTGIISDIIVLFPAPKNQHRSFPFPKQSPDGWESFRFFQAPIYKRKILFPVP